MYKSISRKNSRIGKSLDDRFKGQYVILNLHKVSITLNKVLKQQRRFREETPLMYLTN